MTLDLYSLFLISMEHWYRYRMNFDVNFDRRMKFMWFGLLNMYLKAVCVWSKSFMFLAYSIIRMRDYWKIIWWTECFCYFFGIFYENFGDCVVSMARTFHGYSSCYASWKSKMYQKLMRNTELSKSNTIQTKTAIWNPQGRLTSSGYTL